MSSCFRHRLPFPATRYWTLFADEDAFRRLCLEGLGCTAAEVVEQSGTMATRFTRHSRVVSPTNAPAVLMRLLRLPAELTVDEIGAFDAATACWSYRLEPVGLGGGWHAAGEVRAEPHDDGTCTRVATVTVESDVPAVAGLVSRFVAARVRQNQDRIATFLRSLPGGSL